MQQTSPRHKTPLPMHQNPHYTNTNRPMGKPDRDRKPASHMGGGSGGPPLGRRGPEGHWSPGEAKEEEDSRYIVCEGGTDQDSTKCDDTPQRNSHQKRSALDVIQTLTSDLSNAMSISLLDWTNFEPCGGFTSPVFSSDDSYVITPLTTSLDDGSEFDSLTNDSCSVFSTNTSDMTCSSLEPSSELTSSAD